MKLFVMVMAHWSVEYATVMSEYITNYGSALYIGMDEVLAHYACIYIRNFGFTLPLSVIIYF